MAGERMRFNTIEEFAARRRTDQNDMEKILFPVVAEAVKKFGEKGWYDDLLREVNLLYTETYHREGGKGLPRDDDKFIADVKASLDKTEDPTDTTADRISIWLATAILNAATMEAASTDEQFLVMEWVTMHDSDVRTAHRHTDGQQRPPGEPFDVDGTEMRYPGDPTAPIGLWINCRCALAPALPNQFRTLTAADQPDLGICVVALVDPDDGTHGLYGPANETGPDGQPLPQDPHMTLLWFGKPDENPSLNMDEISAAVKEVSASIQPFANTVGSVDELGDEGALVWLLNEHPAADVQAELLNNKVLRTAWEKVKQYPKFTPHVTIGYDMMLSGDGVEALSSVEEIKFDRLGLWVNGDHYEFGLNGYGGTEDPANMEDDMTASTFEDMVGTPFYSVLAPEGKWSGDGRSFAPGSLSTRDLPLPISWQKMSSEGHNGSVVVAKAEQVARVDGEMRATGHYLMTPEADEAVGLVAEFGRFGISVDADDAEFDFDENTGRVEFTRARIASASQVAIPAFAEAWIALGDAPPGFMGDMPTDMPEGDVCNPDDPAYDQAACDKQNMARLAAALNPETFGQDTVFVSDKPWGDFSESDYTDDQWYAACCLHRNGSSRVKSDNGLPIKEPGGALNRNGVHAAASRFGSAQGPAAAKAAAKSCIRGAYKQIGETPPDSIAADATVEEFKRGPGWLTNPEDTKRIHDYWTVPGKPGYEKIGWGVPGDFNRCRIEVGQEIAENSPETTRFLNQICAQWHHDALGIWPGEHHSLDTTESPQGDPSPAVSLVASSGWCAPSEWFRDPEFEKLTPMTVTEDGRVFGHIAGWKTCHGAYKTCVAPPHSVTGYAHFLTGYVLTDEGPVPTGPITYGTGHASAGSMRHALAHYDNTGTVGADVNIGEDAHGIWVAGMMRPGAPEEAAHIIRASAPSGDWRRDRAHDHLALDGRAMEMIAVLAVNAPGFTVPRVGMRNGEQVSLVAAGVVQAEDGTEPFDREAFADAVAVALTDIERRKQQMAAIAAEAGD